MLAMLYSFVLVLLIGVSSVLAGPLEARHSPDFSLVARTSNHAFDGKLLLIDGSGRTNFAAGTVAKLYLNGIRLSVDLPNTGDTVVINSHETAIGCTAGGGLQISHGMSTNKCARYQPFTIMGHGRNSYLAFNGSGRFFICGGLVSWNDIPMPGCSPVKLYTRPAH